MKGTAFLDIAGEAISLVHWNFSPSPHFYSLDRLKESSPILTIHGWRKVLIVPYCYNTQKRLRRRRRGQWRNLKNLRRTGKI